MKLIKQSQVHPSWQAILPEALSTLPPDYLRHLEQDPHWLPGPQHLFKAFQVPLDAVNAILFGESPYPRQASANGYAFWDAAVQEIWSEKGLSIPVNRATSLRNLIKMLLVAEGSLAPDNTGQAAIARLDHREHVQTLNQLFENLLAHGFLLLNASLVLRDTPVAKDVRIWRPFMNAILDAIHQHRAEATLLLFGRHAEPIFELPHAKPFQTLCAEHPYNVSYITNPTVLHYFQPLQLLKNPTVD